MTDRSIVSPEDQSVTFVELFFDLVFVFSVTQVVGLLHHRLDWVGVGQAVLAFWLVWWAWTQFTWALNAADTTHPDVELGTLVATGIAFFMATMLPGAFEGGGAWFAIPYVLVRGIGLGLYARVARIADPAQHAAVRTFSILSVGGLAAVAAGGFAGGTTQYWLWGLAIMLDVVAAMVAGEAEGWNLRPDHFAERHGLFVIIALGESLIVAAGGLTGLEPGAGVIALGALAVALTCAMWWSYFACAKFELDEALERVTDAERSMLARDAFTLLHFPMILGVIGFAVAIEEIVAHPTAPLELPLRISLAGGLALFLMGIALAVWRATRRVLTGRILLTAIMAAAVIAVSEVSPLVTLTIAFAAVLLIALTEHRELWAGG